MILSSPARNHKLEEMWRTPTCAKIHGMRAAGKSHDKIQKEIGLTRSTIQGIVNGPSSRTTRKGKVYKPKLFSLHDIQRVFCFVSES